MILLYSGIVWCSIVWSTLPAVVRRSPSGRVALRRRLCSLSPSRRPVSVYCGSVVCLHLQHVSGHRKSPSYLLLEPLLLLPMTFRSVIIIAPKRSEVNKKRRLASFLVSSARAASPLFIAKNTRRRSPRYSTKPALAPSERERHTGPAEHAGLVVILPPPVPNYKRSRAKKSPRLLPRALSILRIYPGRGLTYRPRVLSRSRSQPATRPSLSHRSL